MKKELTLLAALILMAALPHSTFAGGIDDLTPEELAEKIANASGIAPKLTLNSAVQGSTVIFARLTRTGQ
ncbi:MAG: hypothetical protein IKR98_06970, partial [Bacteroidaceae bacterium]|nr:hypothetical protein [Bacteroidaceae bacterium]